MDIRELNKLLVTLRKNGVFRFDGLGLKLEFELDALTHNDKKASRPVQDDPESSDTYSSFPDRILTNEELMYYSSGGTQGLAPDELKE